MNNKNFYNSLNEIKVSFQGERGAYSEEAAYKFFGNKIKLRPCKELSEVFESVASNESDYGIVPVENSLEGIVNQAYDLLLSSPLKICGEIILRIVHCLIAHPTADINSIKAVYSHPQALAQCKNFLKKLGCKVIPFFDTAGSIKMIKEEKAYDAAAIAGKRAAEIYQMKVLVEGIEDQPNNYTRFFVLSKNDSPPTGDDKTSIVFSVKHVPGALYHALEEFAIRNINLTKIESRPTRIAPWEYNFYLDFEGHISEERCKNAIDGLKRKSIFIKVLGSYPKAKP
ncbi:MAG: prephenate dehydratase [Nitrososphaeria archaeon]|nr:prephenate dehydratase [Nitrososphaeria archaeon]